MSGYSKWSNNKNRTIGEIKLFFRDMGGSLGEAGRESELEEHDDVVNVFWGFTFNV